MAFAVCSVSSDKLPLAADESPSSSAAITIDGILNKIMQTKNNNRWNLLYHDTHFSNLLDINFSDTLSYIWYTINIFILICFLRTSLHLAKFRIVHDSYFNLIKWLSCVIRLYYTRKEEWYVYCKLSILRWTKDFQILCSAHTKSYLKLSELLTWKNWGIMTFKFLVDYGRKAVEILKIPSNHQWALGWPWFIS